MKKFSLIAASLLALSSFSFAQQASPAEIANAEMEGLGEWLSDTEAQNRAMELMQQGKYVRKSLMVVPMLFWMGEGYDQVRLRHRPAMISALRDSLSHMSRFDINPLSSRSYWGFRDAWYAENGEGQNAKGREATLARLINEKLTPDMLGGMAAMMKQRAEQNLTEDQQNSFMVDKAKESGITAAELNLVLNSGYVVVPTAHFVAFGYDKEGNIQATVKGGLNLYRVVVNKDNISLELRQAIVRVGDAMIDAKGYDPLIKATLPAAWRVLSDEDLCMAFALDKMYNSAMQDMRDIKEFRLLSQMTSTKGSTYEAPFGAGEIKEVVMDKFFEHVEQVEGKDGKIEDAVTGWGFAKKPVNFKVPVKIDSNVTEYIWEGYAAKGEIMSGVVTREYSRLPVDVDFRAGFATMGLDIPASTFGDLFAAVDEDGLQLVAPLTVTAAGAFFQLTSQISLAPWTGISQLMLRVSATAKGAMFADSTLYFSPGSGVYELSGFSQVDGSIGVGKKWWFGRFVPGVAVEGFYGLAHLTGEGDDGFGFTSEVDLKDEVFGVRASANLEYAFTPNFRLGITGGAAVAINSGAWKYTVDDGAETDLSEVFSDDAPTINPVGIEAGAYLSFNLWPLRKVYDAVMQSSTSGLAGAVMQADLRPIQ